MIVEFTNILNQTATEVISLITDKPHIINGFRYNWCVRSELMKINETFQQWISRKEEEIRTIQIDGVPCDGVVVLDWQPCVPMMKIDKHGEIYNIIDDAYKKRQYGSGIIRYSYLNKNKK